MPWVDLGEVCGEDGTVGNIDSTYINNGGEPGVSITRSGEDSAPDLTFNFENLVNDPLTAAELEKIVQGETVNSSNVVNGGVLTAFLKALKNMFAAKEHTHKGDDIEEKTITSVQLADHSVGKDQLETTVWDSISQSAFFEPSELVTVSKAEARKFGPVVAVNFELRAIGEIPAGNVMLGTVSGQCRAVQASPLPTYGTNGQLAYISGTSIRANLVYDIPAGRTLYLAGCYLVS